MSETPYRDRSGPPPDDDERYTFVDLRDYDQPHENGDGDGDEDLDEAPPQRPRRATRGKAPAKPRKTSRKARGKTGRRRGGRDRSGEYAIGALVSMAVLGYLAYRLTAEVMGQPRDVCLVVAGLAAGLSTWTPRTFEALRRGLARTIAPKGGR